MSVHSSRAARALAHLAEVDPALAVLALWCQHRDGPGITKTTGDVITYGPGHDTLGLPEQVGTVAHHVLHVALRHSARAAGLAERLGAGFDPALFGLAADGIINETLILAGHAVPRPAVTLTELLTIAGLAAPSAIAALETWDCDRLAMALHSDAGRAKRVAEWGRTRGFVLDVSPGDRGAAERGDTAEWRNRMLRALEAGRKAGSGIGRLGAVLADLSPETIPWEVHLRGALARALADRPHPNWRRPSGRWIARMVEAERGAGPVPIYEPGISRLDHRPRLVIGLDTSSSIDPVALRLFLAEAQSITRRSGAEVHLLAFDEQVHATHRLDPIQWQVLHDMPLRVGGGTDYHDLFAQAARLRPSVLVVLTDLDAPFPPAPDFALIWAAPGDPAPPPYGRYLRIDQGIGRA